MFLILGSPRSGTTLLATTLSLHPSIHVIDQTNFIVPAAFIFERIENRQNRERMLSDFIGSSSYFKSSIGKYLNGNDIERLVKQNSKTLTNLLQAIYAEIAVKLNKTEIGDKSVSDISFFSILDKVNLFDGKIKVIHIVRDVRAITASLDSLGWIKNRHIYPRSWNNANLSLFDLLSKKDYYYFLRYEDFVVNSSNILHEICGFLGFEYSEDMEKSSERGLEYTCYSYHKKLQQTISCNYVYTWKKLSNKA